MATITKRELAIKITDRLGQNQHKITQQEVLDVIQRSSRKSLNPLLKEIPW